MSGGQTGIDQMALEVARSLGVPTGGMAPKGCLVVEIEY
ncbi:YpsA SLOG family protein [Fibrisoma montanum]